jgi:hypothetical protein
MIKFGILKPNASGYFGITILPTIAGNMKGGVFWRPALIRSSAWANDENAINGRKTDGGGFSGIPLRATLVFLYTLLASQTMGIGRGGSDG